MTTLYRAGLCVLLLLAPVIALCQQPTDGVRYSIAPGSGIVTFVLPIPAEKQPGITMSGRATSARIADPNERVVFSGQVMRMADFVAAVSSSTAAAQRPHTQEMHSRETNPLAPPSLPKD